MLVLLLHVLSCALPPLVINRQTGRDLWTVCNVVLDTKISIKSANRLKISNYVIVPNNCLDQYGI